jgi:hypothetical protein
MRSLIVAATGTEVKWEGMEQVTKVTTSPTKSYRCVVSREQVSAFCRFWRRRRGRARRFGLPALVGPQALTISL